MFKDYIPTTSFFTKDNPKDLRLGDCAKSLTQITDLKDSVVILGYPDDEGIKNNSGRSGASEGPKAIREAFYKFTPHLLQKTNPKIYDLGDLKIEGTIQDRHNAAQKNLQDLLPKTKVVTLGGGHDYGYPDGAAFLETFKSKSDKDLRPLVINFDAHLDVRPPKKENNQEVISSGTPFYRLLENYSDFDFLEIGVQSQCNSRFHYEWALSKGAHVLTYDEMMYSGIPMHTKILEFLEPFLLKKRACYLSIDIDGFSSTYAPGCSQSFATGFNPESFFTVLKVLTDRLDIRLLGIYEVSPKLDTNKKTSKLAAQLIFQSL